MAKIKGICRNEECDLCDEIQEAEKSNFVCEKCGKQLMPFGCVEEVSFLKKYEKQLTLAGGVLAVVALGAGGYFAFSGNSTPANPKGVDSDSIVKMTPIDTATVQKPDTTTKEKTTELQETNPGDAKPTPPPPPPPTPKNGHGTVRVSYGKYTGYLENGEPHGHGVVIFTSSYRFAEGISAEPGDKYEGEFRNGRISGMGYLYHDGNQTMVRP